MGDAVAVVALALTITGLGCPGGLPCDTIEDLLAPLEGPLDALGPVLAEVDRLLQATGEPATTDLLTSTLPGPGQPLVPSDHAPSDRPAPERIAAGTPVEAVVARPHVGDALARDGGPSIHATRAAPPGLEATRATPSPEQAAAGLALGLGLMGLFHRLGRQRLLAHPTRQRLLELLRERPGQRTNALAEATACSYRTVRHHLEKLRRHGLVATFEAKGVLVWCLPSDRADVRDRLDPRERRALAVLEQEPGLHLSAVADRLGVAKATAKLQLDRLVERELVVEERVGPLRCFRPVDGARSGHS